VQVAALAAKARVRQQVQLQVQVPRVAVGVGLALLEHRDHVAVGHAGFNVHAQLHSLAHQLDVGALLAHLQVKAGVSGRE